MNRLIEKFNIPEFTHGYGQTETSPIVAMSECRDPFLKKSRTVGRVHHHTEIKITNPETGEIVPWGEAGEVCARGYQVMSGYWNDQQKTNEAIDSRGWIKTGDLG